MLDLISQGWVATKSELAARLHLGKHHFDDISLNILKQCLREHHLKMYIEIVTVNHHE